MKSKLKLKSILNRLKSVDFIVKYLVYVQTKMINTTNLMLLQRDTSIKHLLVTLSKRREEQHLQKNAKRSSKKHDYEFFFSI